MSNKKLTKEEALWIFLATYIIAIYMIIQNPLNEQNWLISLLLIAFGTVSSPDARNMYKISLNFVFKKHIFNIEDAVIIKSNVINQARDVKITQIFVDKKETDKSKDSKED
jgi:predicted membrane protein